MAVHATRLERDDHIRPQLTEVPGDALDDLVVGRVRERTRVGVLGRALHAAVPVPEEAHVVHPELSTGGA